MSIEHLLAAKNDLANYSKNSVDLIAKSLGVSASDYDEKLWLTTMKLHGKQRAQMPGKDVLSDIDVWMARFSWNANQLKDSMTEKEVAAVERLLNLYREYLQDGESNDTKIRNEINRLVNQSSVSINKPVLVSPSPQLVKVRMPPGNGLENGDDNDLVGETTKDPPVHTVNPNVRLTGKDRKGIRAKLKQQLDNAQGSEGQKLRQVFYDDQGRFKQEALTETYSILRERNSDLMANIGKQFAIMQENSRGSDDQLENRLIVIEEMLPEVLGQLTRNTKLLETVHEGQMKSQSLTDVAWYNLPKKIKLEFVKGFKKAMLYVAFAPISFPFLITKHFVVNPVVETVEFFSKYIRLAWGITIIVIGFGNALHIYYSTDWTYLNEILESKLSKNIYNYLTFFVDWGWKYTPSSSEIIAAYKQLWANLGETFIGGLIDQLGGLTVYLKDGIAKLICSAIEHLASSTWGYGFGTASKFLCTAATQEQSSSWWPFG